MLYVHQPTQGARFQHLMVNTNHIMLEHEQYVHIGIIVKGGWSDEYK